MKPVTTTILLLTMTFWLSISLTGKPEMTKPGANPPAAQPYDGKGWLGLFRAGSGFELRPWQADAPLDPSQSLAVSNRAEDEEQPLFLVRGFEGIQPGTIPTVHGESRALSPGTDLIWGEQETEYRLLVTGKLLVPQGPRLLIDYQLTLSLDGRDQILHQQQQFTGDPVPRLLWAGDLDGDHRIDLFMDMDGETSKTLMLFLSSAAEPGEHLRKAADLRIPF